LHIWCYEVFIFYFFLTHLFNLHFLPSWLVLQFPLLSKSGV
jgi:hypothetical protein